MAGRYKVARFAQSLLRNLQVDCTSCLGVRLTALATACVTALRYALCSQESKCSLVSLNYLKHVVRRFATVYA